MAVADMEASMTATRDELLSAIKLFSPGMHHIACLRANHIEDASAVNRIDAASSLLRRSVNMTSAEIQDCLLIMQLQIEGSAPEPDDITYRFAG